MIQQILSFLLQVVATLVGGAALLRVAMRWQRMSMANPVGRFVRALTDWLVLPLQRLLPPGNRFDAASLLAAFIVKLLHYGLLLALLGLLGAGGWASLPVLALLGVVRLAVSVMTALVIIAAILSWTQNRTLVTDVLDQLTAPWLAPIRRIVPLVGGVDLSPLVLIVLLQVVGMALGGLQAGLAGGWTVAAA